MLIKCHVNTRYAIPAASRFLDGSIGVDATETQRQEEPLTFNHVSVVVAVGNQPASDRAEHVSPDASVAVPVRVVVVSGYKYRSGRSRSLQSQSRRWLAHSHTHIVAQAHRLTDTHRGGRRREGGSSEEAHAPAVKPRYVY